MSNIVSKVGSRISSVGALAFRSKTNDVDLLTLDPADNRVQLDKVLGFGTPESATIASGVITVTKSHVIPLPESSTTDTVTSIVLAGVQAGDVILFHVPATNTITFDDANINLGGATRAVAPGGSLLVVYDGTEWSEVAFLAGADNA